MPSLIRPPVGPMRSRIHRNLRHTCTLTQVAAGSKQLCGIRSEPTQPLCCRESWGALRRWVADASTSRGGVSDAGSACDALPRAAASACAEVGAQSSARFAPTPGKAPRRSAQQGPNRKARFVLG